MVYWRGPLGCYGRHLPVCPMARDGAEQTMTTDPDCSKNVFQLWKEGGERLPFKVIRWTWTPGASAFLMERIEIGKCAVRFATSVFEPEPTLGVNWPLPFGTG